MCVSLWLFFLFMLIFEYLLPTVCFINFTFSLLTDHKIPVIEQCLQSH